MYVITYKGKPMLTKSSSGIFSYTLYITKKEAIFDYNTRSILGWEYGEPDTKITKMKLVKE